MVESVDSDPIPYEVAFVYKCRICKQLHSEYGRLTQPGVVLTHQNELKERLLELVKENFFKAHPKRAFMYSDLTVHEFVNGNKTVVDPKTIKVKGKPQPEEKEEIPQIEKVLPLPMMGTNVAGIEKMLVVRMAEIRKREKEVDEKVKELTEDLEGMTTELAELEQLLKAAEEINAKKSGKEKKK